MCWVQVVVAIVMIIVGELLRPKVKNTSKPAGLGDFQFPTSEAGRVFPIVAGTVKILGPNTTNQGRLRTEESYKRVKSGWFSTSKQHYGWRYYLYFQQVVCGGPIDTFLGIQVNDKFLLQTITSQPHWFLCGVHDPSFYGDPKQDGGFSGNITVYKGTATQPYDTGLLSISPGQTQISAYRNVCYMMFSNFYVGMSTTPPPFVPILGRFPNSLGIDGGRHIINVTGSNPICFVYDLMVNTIREGAIPETRMDKASFLACAATVFSEGIGVSIILDNSQSLDDAVKSVMQYADGQVFEDPFTGLFTCKLVRGDYNVDTLLELNEDNSRCVGRTKTNWSDTKNTINVNYVDKDKNWTNQSVSVQDLANLIVLQGQVNATDIDFTGCDNAALANYLAERARQAMSTPFTQLEIESHGIGATMRINDVFKVNYPNRRISNMIMRVTDVEYPNVDDSVCKIKAVEDKFGVKFVVYDQVPNHQWQEPNMNPAPALYEMVEEVPLQLSPDGTDNLYALAAVVRQGGVETGFDVYNIDAGTTDNSIDALTSGALVAVPLTIDGLLYGTTQAQGLVVNTVVDGQNIESVVVGDYQSGQNLVQMGNEIIAFQNATDNGDGTLTLWPWTRAMYDTIPETHAANQPAFFLSTGLGLTRESPYTATGTYHYKFPTRAYDVLLPLASAVTETLVVKSRAKRPYPPGNVTVNGTRIQLINQANKSVVTTITLTWKHRNRLTQGPYIIPYDSTDVTPETGTTYVVRYYDNDVGTLLSTQSAITANTTSTTLPGFTGNVRAEITAARDGLESNFITSGVFAYVPAPGALTISGVAPNGIVGVPYGTAQASPATLTTVGGNPLTTPSGNTLVSGA